MIIVFELMTNLYMMCSFAQPTSLPAHQHTSLPAYQHTSIPAHQTSNSSRAHADLNIVLSDLHGMLTREFSGSVTDHIMGSVENRLRSIVNKYIHD